SGSEVLRFGERPGSDESGFRVTRRVEAGDELPGDGASAEDAPAKSRHLPHADENISARRFTTRPCRTAVIILTEISMQSSHSSHSVCYQNTSPSSQSTLRRRVTSSDSSHHPATHRPQVRRPPRACRFWVGNSHRHGRYQIRFCGP